MFTKLYLVFSMIQCFICFTKYRLLNVDVYYDVAYEKIDADYKLLCARECMEERLCCAAFAYHEIRKSCHLYNFKLQTHYANITDPGLITFVDVEEGGEKWYNITIGTGDHVDAGTNAHVSLQFTGSSTEHDFDLAYYDDFARNALDSYQVYDAGVTDMAVVLYKNDNSDVNPSWLLANTSITTCLSDETTRMIFMNRNDGFVTIPRYEMYFYECNCWLNSQTSLERNVALQKQETTYTNKINRI